MGRESTKNCALVCLEEELAHTYTFKFVALKKGCLLPDTPIETHWFRLLDLGRVPEKF